MKRTNSKQRRAYRVRNRIRKAAEKNNRPRLSVSRTGRHISAQIIDDVKGVTLVSASTLEADVKKDLKITANKDAASTTGRVLAERAKKAGVEKVSFDRGSFDYHGRVKALADAAREAGLSF